MSESKFLLNEVMLIDDNTYINYLNKSLIEALGVAQSVTVANDGIDALDLIQKNHSKKSLPELIFLDLIMPQVDGIEFMKAFKDINNSLGKRSRVVVLTNCGREIDLNTLLSLGADELLYKPLTSAKIHNLLAKLFLQ